MTLVRGPADCQGGAPGDHRTDRQEAVRPPEPWFDLDELRQAAPEGGRPGRDLLDECIHASEGAFPGFNCVVVEKVRPFDFLLFGKRIFGALEKCPVGPGLVNEPGARKGFLATVPNDFSTATIHGATPHQIRRGSSALSNIGHFRRPVKLFFQYLNQGIFHSSHKGFPFIPPLPTAPSRKKI